MAINILENKLPNIGKAEVFMTAIKIFEKAIGLFADMAILLLGLGALYLLWTIFRDEGLSGIRTTLAGDVMNIFVRFLPVLLIFFVITGAINHLQKRHGDEFKKIIAGEKGTARMVALAAIMPGPAGGQQLQDAWNNGGDKSKIMLCLAGMMILGVNAFIFRAKVLGGPLTLIWACTAFCLYIEIWVVCRIKPWEWL